MSGFSAFADMAAINAYRLLEDFRRNVAFALALSHAWERECRSSAM